MNVTSPVTLTGMRINNNITAGAVCEVWYRSGTHVGFEGSSAGWTQIFNGPVAAAQGYVTGLNLPLSNGITSFFVFLPAGGITYTNGVSLGAVYASDANLAIQEGYGTGGTFGSGLFWWHSNKYPYLERIINLFCSELRKRSCSGDC